METTLNDTKIFSEIQKKREARRQFDCAELSNVKRIILELTEDPLRGRYHKIEYVIELIDKPIKWYLQGEKLQNSVWYRHTISDNYNFSAELGLIRTTKEI